MQFGYITIVMKFKNLQQILDKLLKIGSSDTDDEALRLKKSSLLLVPLIIGPAAFIWGVIYLAFGHFLSAAIPLSYSLISVFNLWHLHKTKDIAPLQNIQLILVLILPFLLMWSLGGFAQGSFVMIWAFFAPVAALTYESENKPHYWFYAFMLLLLFSSIINQTLIESSIPPLPPVTIEVFNFLNISAGLSGLFFLMRYFINEKEKNAMQLLQKEHETLKLRTEELRVANSKLQYFAKHDALTELSNRHHLHDQLNQMMAYAKRHNLLLALMFIDLDGFKKVNDTCGHAVGDEVLREVAQRIKSLLREEDLIARLGGDEFAVGILSSDDITYIKDIARRLIEEIRREYSDLAAEIPPISASIGISLFPEHTQNIDELLNFADEAMYYVKNSSKNSFFIRQTVDQ